MPGEVIQLVLPLPPRLTNSGKGRSRHWRALKKEKDTYWATLDNLQLLGRIPPPPKRPIERAEARVKLFLWNYMDDSGAMARLKWPEDWLVTRGYLVNNNRECLRYVGLPEQEIDRRNPRMVLTLTPLTEENADDGTDGTEEIPHRLARSADPPSRGSSGGHRPRVGKPGRRAAHRGLA